LAKKASSVTGHGFLETVEQVLFRGESQDPVEEAQFMPELADSIRFRAAACPINQFLGAGMRTKVEAVAKLVSIRQSSGRNNTGKHLANGLGNLF
jgi:hypothetical protein